MNVENMQDKDFEMIFKRSLEEFPVTEIGFELPNWFDILNLEHWLKQDVISLVKEMLKKELSVELISEITKLTIKEIEELQKK